MSCRNFKGAMETQGRELREAIEEDKWYLSERAGHDVGQKCAEIHFLDAFVQRWAQNWRKVWCSERCPFRDVCEERHGSSDGNTGDEDGTNKEDADRTQ